MAGRLRRAHRLSQGEVDGLADLVVVQFFLQCDYQVSEMLLRLVFPGHRGGCGEGRRRGVELAGRARRNRIGDRLRSLLLRRQAFYEVFFLRYADAVGLTISA